MKRKLGLVIVLLALFFVLTPALTTNAHAASVQAGSSLPTLSALENTCSEIDVHLNGTQPPTITCAQAKGVSTAPPPTKATPCQSTNDFLVDYVQPNGDYGNVCFTGRGYLGYRINNAYGIYSNDRLNSWFLWYFAGSSQGTYDNLNSSNGWSVYISSAYNVDITQVDLGAQHA